MCRITYRYENLPNFLNTDIESSYQDLKKIRRIPTNLTKARLYKCKLENSDFAGAILRDVDMLTSDQLLKVKTLYQSKLDYKVETEIKIAKKELFNRPYLNFIEDKTDSLAYKYPNSHIPEAEIRKLQFEIYKIR